MERYNIYIVILCIFAVTSLAEVWIEIRCLITGSRTRRVTSLAEVWIEIYELEDTDQVAGVTSLAEVWIEMAAGCHSSAAD